MTTVRPTFIQPAAVVAVPLATIPGVVQGVVTLSGLQAVFFVGAVLVAMVLAIPCLAWAERRDGDRALHLVLAGYFTAIAVALWLSRGHSFLIAMPLASMLVLYLPLRHALLLTAVLFVLSVAAVGVDVSKLSVAVSFGSAFVVVFSLIARRERFARMEIERLSAQLETLAASRERNRIAREIHDLRFERVALSRRVPDSRERFVAFQAASEGVNYQGYGAQGLGAQWFVDVKPGVVSDITSSPIEMTKQP